MISETNRVLLNANTTLASCRACMRQLLADGVRGTPEARRDLAGAIDAARGVQEAYAQLVGFDEFTQHRVRRMSEQLAECITQMEDAYVRLASPDQQYQGA